MAAFTQTFMRRMPQSDSDVQTDDEAVDFKKKVKNLRHNSIESTDTDDNEHLTNLRIDSVGDTDTDDNQSRLLNAYNYQYSDAEETLNTLMKNPDGYLFLRHGVVVHKLPVGSILFTHSKKIGLFGAKFNRLRNLMDKMAMLQFAHDYFTRVQLFSNFINDLEQLVIVESTTLNKINRSTTSSFASSTKLEYLSAICENMRVHENHWNSLRHKLVSNSKLRTLIERLLVKKLNEMNATFLKLHNCALMWITQLISVGLQVFPKCDPRHFTDDILWDIARGLEDYKALCAQARVNNFSCCTVLSQSSLLSDLMLPSKKFCSRSVNFDQMPFELLLHYLARERSKYMATHVCEVLVHNFSLSACKLLLHVPQNQLFINQSSDFQKREVLSDRRSDTSDYQSLSTDTNRKNRSILAEKCFTQLLPSQYLDRSDISTTILKELNFLSDEALKEEEFAYSFLRVVYTSTSMLSNANKDTTSIDAMMVSSKFEKSRHTASFRGQEMFASTTVVNDDMDMEKGDSSYKRKSVSWSSDSAKTIVGEHVDVYLKALWFYFGVHAIDQLLRPTWNKRNNNTAQLGSCLLCPTSVKLSVAMALAQACESGVLPKLSGSAICFTSMKLISLGVLASWDSAFCAALGNSVTDKCHPTPLSDEDCCTQTASLLQQSFLPLKKFLQLGSIVLQEKNENFYPMLTPIMWRLEPTLALVVRWCSTKSSHFIGTWALGPFLLVTYKDLKLLNDLALNTVSTLWELLKKVDPSSNDLLYITNECDISHQHLVGLCSQLQTLGELINVRFKRHCHLKAEEFFYEAIPVNKLWSRKAMADAMPSSQDYVELAAKSLLEPVLRNVLQLGQTVQLAVLLTTVSATCQAWTDAILKRKIKFSLTGVQQLDRDFGYLVSWLADNLHVPEVRQSVLSLEIFRYMRAIIEVLQQQPQNGLGCRSSDKSANAYNRPETTNGASEMSRISSSRQQASVTITEFHKVSDNDGSINISWLSANNRDKNYDYVMPRLNDWLSRRLNGNGSSSVPWNMCLPRPEHV